jgi:ribosome-binding protein aMBF1 (putative translation factor)
VQKSKRFREQKLSTRYQQLINIQMRRRTMKQDENSKAMATVDQDVEAVMKDNFYYFQALAEKIARRIEVELDGEVKGYDQIIANLAGALEHVGRLALRYKPSSQECGKCEGVE